MPATLPRHRAAALAAVTALAGLLVAACSGSAPPPAASSTSARPTPTTSTATSTAPAPTPMTSTPAARSAPHDVVAAGAPTRFTFRAKGFTIRAGVCGMENVRPLDPPGEQHHTVCWVQHDFGFAPASSGRGTTYVLGHSWAQDPDEVLNKISERAMRELLPQLHRHARPQMITGQPTYPLRGLDGSVMTLTTPNGRLGYTVREAYAVRKSIAGYVRPLVDQDIRNRVVLITCGELDGVDYDYNIVLAGYLTSARAVRAHGAQT